MIITRTPYRISFFGGSTDYQSFYKDHGSIVIGTTIDKYCYSMCKNYIPLDEINYQVYYSSVEKVSLLNHISNPGVRGTLEFLNEKIDDMKNIAIYIQNDLPARTGVGTSSSLIVGLLNGMYKLYNKYKINKKQLALEAIEIERNRLKEPGGIQDQILAAYGGFNKIEINKDGTFSVKPLSISEDFLEELRKCMIIFSTQTQRDSFKIAKSHDNKASEIYKKEILDMAKESERYFNNEHIENIGTLLEKSWQAKKRISNMICNDYIDELHDSIIHNGAFGCKLLGSGQGGFLLCIAPPINRKKIIDSIKLPVVDVDFDNTGSSIIFKDNGV